MSVGIGAGIAIAAGASAGASLYGAHKASSAATDAAKIQSTAAEQIRQQAIDAANKATGDVNLATTDANSTLTDAQKAQLALLQPYIDSGKVSLSDLTDLLGTNGPLGKSGDFSFTANDWQKDPGYDYIKQQAIQAAQREAAASGTLLTGGFQKGLARQITGLASTHLDDAFNRALSTYQTNRQNLLTRIQGLQGTLGLGFNATQLGESTVGNTAAQIAQNKLNAGRYSGDTSLQAAQIGAQAIGAKADSEAAAKVASGNAWNTGLTNAGQAVLNGTMLYSLPQVTRPTYSIPTTNAGGAGLKPPTTYSIPIDSPNGVN